MRTVSVAVAAAVTAGVLVGLLARLGMALVALAAGHSTQFSLAGTAIILFIYSAAMLPGALAAAFTRRRVRWILPVAGALFLVLPAVGVASEEIGDVAGLAPLRMVLLVIMGIAVFATLPAVALVTVRLVDRFQGHSSTDPTPGGARDLETARSGRPSTD